MGGIFPAVFKEGENVIAEMRDRNGKVWSRGSGLNAQQAMYAARNSLPEKGAIRTILGWGTKHPIISAAVITLAKRLLSPGAKRMSWGGSILLFGAAFALIVAAKHFTQAYTEQHE